MSVEIENDSCLLTAPQLSKKLRVCATTILVWRRKRIIPAIVIGGVTRFELARVVEALRAYETPIVHRTGLASRYVPSAPTTPTHEEER